MLVTETQKPRGVGNQGTGGKNSVATLVLFCGVFPANLCAMGPLYVVGVDGGTEGIRAGVFDLEGNALAFASTSYSTIFPQPGWAEQVCVTPRHVAAGI